MARQVVTPHGLAYQVWVPADRPAGSAAARVDGEGTQRLDATTTLELVRLADRLQRENRDLAGLVGSLQQRLLLAEDRTHALEAPRAPDPSPDASERDSDGGALETAWEPTERNRPWWRFW